MNNDIPEFENTKLLNAFMVVGFIAVMYGFIYMYLDIPVIAKNPDGTCEWIMTDGIEKRTCPLVLPEKHITQYVDFNNRS